MMAKGHADDSIVRVLDVSRLGSGALVILAGVGLKLRCSMNAKTAEPRNLRCERSDFPSCLLARGCEDDKIDSPEMRL